MTWNDQTRPYKDDRGTWTEVPSNIIIDDWDRIGDYYKAYYRIGGVSAEIARTVGGVKFPNGIPDHIKNKSNRKIMRPVSDGNVLNPGLKIIEKTN